MIKKLYIKTWGCQMNQYDSNKIAFHLKDKYSITSVLNKAHLIILNTCSIRQKTQEKLYNKLGVIKKVKEKNCNLIVIVSGCVSVQEKEKIFYRNSVVDIILGPKNIHKISYLIDKFKKNKKKISYFKNISIENNFTFLGNKYSKYKKTFTYVPIMDGCNKFCSYCIVPFTRGKEISRSPENIISEICRLSLYGISEINLLGQNVNAYCGLFKNNKKCNFSHLLKLISNINGIKRIKFTTSHPNDFSNELINIYSKLDKIVNFLHLPIQSGSDKILKKMRRNYTVKYYKKLVRKILCVRKKMVFGSDFIVGFPTENIDDFKLTLDLISEIKFDNSFVFIYSPRPYTRSFNMLDDVSIIEKKNRLYQINNLLYKNSIY